MKRVIAIIISCFLVLGGLAACGQKAETDNGASTEIENSASANTEKDSATVEADKNEQITINYYTWRGNPAMQYPEKMIEAFQEKYPNIKVEVGGIRLPNDQYLNNQKVKLLSGDSIDVTTLRPETIADYVKAGYLEDLTDKPFLNNVTSTEKVKVDGKVYSIPSAVNVIGVYYNKNIFNKLNITEPKNWVEFVAALEKIKEAGIVPMMNGGKDGWPMEFDIYPFIHDVLVKNPDIFDKVNKGEVKYTDSVFIEAFKKIEDFYKKGYVGKQSVSIGGDGANTLFTQEKTALLIHGEWAMNVFAGKDSKGNDIKLPFEVGIMPLPYNAPGEETLIPISVDSSEGVVASSKNKDAALKFVEFMASSEGATYISNGLSAFSPVKGAGADFNPLAASWKPLLEMKSVPFFYSLQYPAANAEMLKQLQLMFLGDANAEKALKAIQAAQDKREQ
jgi:raffinose/stachyose/melibiose transport system substrate-binding protein